MSDEHNTEDPPPSVVVAVSRVMRDVQAVRKDQRNAQQGYQFRGIDQVMNAVGPVLRNHGVVVVPMLERAEWRDVQTNTGKASRECTVSVRFRFYGPAGDYIDAVTPGESMDFGDKGAPKAMSVAFRTALLQALCLPTDEADPDSSSFERVIGGNRVPPPVPTAADRAKGRVKDTAHENGLSLDDVSEKFAAAHDGATLKACQDPDVIEAFRLTLIPDEAAREPVSA